MIKLDPFKSFTSGIVLHANNNQISDKNPLSTEKNILKKIFNLTAKTNQKNSFIASFQNPKTNKNYFITLSKIETIEHGSFGQVFRWKIKKSLFALKVAYQDEISFKALNKEVKILNYLHQNKEHPPTGIQAPLFPISLISGYSSYVTTHYNFDLFNFFHECKKNGLKLPMESCFLGALELVQGLNYLHNKNIVHRDIKPENCLVKISKKKERDLFHFLLSDFGRALQLDNEKKEDLLRFYLFEEKNNDLAFDLFINPYNNENDKTMFFILYDYLNEKKQTDEILKEIKKLLKAKDVYSLALTLENTLLMFLKEHDKIRDLLEKMKEDDYSKRLSIEDSLQILNNLKFEILSSNLQEEKKSSMNSNPL